MCCSCSTCFFLTIFVSSVVLTTMVASGIVLLNTKSHYLVESEFEPKLMAILNLITECVHSWASGYGYGEDPPVPFSSTLTNQKKNRYKIKLPNNFDANLSH